MPKIHTVEQGAAEWLQLRVGKVTASELGNLVTPEFAARKGETPHTYLCSKLAEAWRGAALPGFSSHATEQGQILEDEARRWYAFAFDRERIQNVGFVEHDDGRCGCSPDALIDDDSGLELKCPEPTNHVRYLLAGELPKAYTAQVHMSITEIIFNLHRTFSHRQQERQGQMFERRAEESRELMDEAQSNRQEKSSRRTKCC